MPVKAGMPIETGERLVGKMRDGMAEDRRERTAEKGEQKTAVAVAYQPGERAPKILAAGKGEIAERIIETAKENDVPFYQDDKLADTLSKLEIGSAIPPELYEVVAEILVFVDDMDRMKSKLKDSGLL